MRPEPQGHDPLELAARFNGRLFLMERWVRLATSVLRVLEGLTRAEEEICFVSTQNVKLFCTTFVQFRSRETTFTGSPSRRI